MNVLLSQVIGIIAFLIFINSLKEEERKDILFFQIIAFLLYTIQYFFIYAFSGMIFFL